MIRNPQDLYTKSFLPSRKLRIILATIVGIAVLAWLIPYAWAWIRTPGKGKTLPEPINPSVTTTSDTYLDSDEDGIPDWKEQFIKTYGVVKSNEEGSPADGSITGTLAILDTIPDTEKISLEIAARLGDGAISNESAALATKQTIQEYIDSISASLRAYSLYDITIGDTDTIEDERAYATTIDPFLSNSSLLSSDRITAITNFYTNVSTETGKILILKTDLRKTIEKLLAMSVPGNATDIHLQYVNNLSALYQLLDVPIEQSDSVKVFSVFSLIQKYLYDIGTMPITYSQYFFVTLDANMYPGI